jgi:hypothetical protein
MDESRSTPQIPRYRPGDIIEMDIQISHRARMNIESVEVRFRTEGSEETNRTELVLAGSPRVSDEKPQAEDTSTEEAQPEGTRWTVARTKEEVSPNHAPGVYNFFSIIVNTSGDLRFLLEDDEMTMGLFDRSFEVVRESDRPKILSGRFVR